MQDNLPELRDIHSPVEDIPIFPLAYGWWIIIITIVVLLVVSVLGRFLWLKSKKRYALELLEKNYSSNLSSAVKMSEILRRICVYKYPNAASVFGQEWIDFLNNHTHRKITGKTARLLLDAPYIHPNSKVYHEKDITDLYTFCRQWIGENL